MNRTISKYTSLTGEEEDRRLSVQNKALYFFDHDIYRRTFEKYSDPAILDVGCGSGNMIRSVLSDVSKFRLFGVDEVERQILLAKEAYPSGHFYALDVEAGDFFPSMEKIMEENGVKGFDVINCSMIILHLKDPVSFLSKLRLLLSENGTLIIRDVDDGIHFSWPDPDNCFRKFCEVIARDDRMGDRHCGRKIFDYLTKAGYSKIKHEKEGLSTADVDDRMLLFNLFFPDMINYMKQRLVDFPDNEQWKKDYQWFCENYDLMKNAFDTEGFIFSIGFMSFTAGR
jgi:SAM-dependent methyltransferase